jgi:transposase
MIVVEDSPVQSQGGDAVGYWDQAPLPRDQLVLIPTTLGDCVSEDHPVRVFHDVLRSVDWSPWERHYCQVAGQPPIPPMIVAGAILYGLSLGIRSSRRLEYACKNSVDFMWLVEGRHIDHSTFCKFRTRFERELKDLFRQIGRLAMGMGLIRLNEVGLDGTRVLANSSRHSTATAKTLEERLAALDEQIEALFARMSQEDGQENDLFGDSYTPHHLPPELADVKRRQAALQKALAKARAAEAKRPRKERTKKKGVKVPVADPDSTVLPNKEGGYAPNYNPTAAVDGHGGLILDADVSAGASEPETVIPTVERIEADFGEKPAKLLADTNFAAGSNLSNLDERGVEAYMPVDPNRTAPGNPALRDDPTQPVPESDWPKLPRRPQSKKLDRTAFFYDAQADCYYCPMGQKLEYEQTKRKDRSRGDDSVYRVYRCTACGGCPLAAACLSGSTKSRTVSHDQHEAQREAMAARMRTEDGRKTYGRRAWIAETPYAVIKQMMGLRRFLLRGLDKVRTEWLWTCTAFNLQKLARYVGVLRAQLAMAMN